MYNQLMNDINRHIVVVWQSVSVLVGAFALWSLVEKAVISLDVAAALIVVIAVWVISHVYDAAYWYNRNLVMIANIERQFLKQSDLREVHYYFGEHRSKTSMLTHLVLQKWLALGVTALVLGVHFSERVLPVLTKSAEFTMPIALPWVALVIGLFIWNSRSGLAQKKYAEFLENSPGKEIDASEINYGVGHPTDPKD